jgi:hypothetical protein
MTRFVTVPVMFVIFGAVARLVFALSWVQSGCTAAILAVLFWLLARSEERLGRVEACLGTDRK